MKQDLKNITLNELIQYCRGIEQPQYRAEQIFTWVYQKRINNFSAMTNIPEKIREKLMVDFYLSETILKTKQQSRDGTQKFLFSIEDGNLIESVMIPQAKRNTLCISTQVGCKYVCEFCASGKSGLIRNLTQSEILNQILFIDDALEGKRISNIVFMGSGEPLDNYENVLKSIRIIISKNGFHIGQRKITISTAGVADKIKQLAKEGLQVELSVSLHSADNKKRSKAMPINRKYPLEVLIPAIKEFIKMTKRKVTFEYILFGGFNTSIEDAKALLKLLKGVHCKINLIPYNDIGNGVNCISPKKLEVLFFKDCLEKNKMEATIRKPRGEDILAACGQLRSYAANKEI